MRRQLRTARNLEEEVAPIVADYIVAEARALLASYATPPDDESTLSQAIRRCYDILATKQGGQGTGTRKQVSGIGALSPTPVARSLSDFETDASQKPRDEQSEAERARLDTQTDDILRLLKADQISE